MRGVLGLAVVAALIAAPACGDEDSDSGTGSTPPTAASEAFFSQTAQRATLTGGRLTLDGVAASITAIADRPARSLAQINVADFVGSWSARFQGDPPNAVLAGERRGTPRSVALVVDEPSHEPARDRLVYEAKPLASASTLPSLRLATVSLVIDPASETIYEITLAVRVTAEHRTYEETLRTLRLSDIANVSLVVSSAPDGSTEVHQSENPDQEGYLEIANELDETLYVEVSENGTSLLNRSISSDGTEVYRPPPPG